MPFIPWVGLSFGYGYVDDALKNFWAKTFFFDYYYYFLMVAFESVVEPSHIYFSLDICLEHGKQQMKAGRWGRIEAEKYELIIIAFIIYLKKK